MALFENKDFVSHAGVGLHFKIECDALSDGDIETLADIVQRRLSFGSVHGVPRGGVRLANALQKFCVPCSQVLIVDDVFTTGMSMEEARKKIGQDSLGVVIFARNTCPEWIYPIFELSKWARR